jgi:hypothetical protein
VLSHTCCRLFCCPQAGLDQANAEVEKASAELQKAQKEVEKANTELKKAQDTNANLLQGRESEARRHDDALEDAAEELATVQTLSYPSCTRLPTVYWTCAHTVCPALWLTDNDVPCNGCLCIYIHALGRACTSFAVMTVMTAAFR